MLNNLPALHPEGAFSGGFIEAAGQSVREILPLSGRILTARYFESPSMLEQKGNLIIHA